MPRLWLNQKIGEGAYGKVYSGYFDTISTPVALKVITVDHKNIDTDLCPAVRDVLVGSVSPIRKGVIQFKGDSMHQFGIVTDLGSCNLHHISQDMPLHCLRIIGKRILMQLVELHEKGIMHRDIKPENILLKFLDAEYPDVNIIDFGLSSAQVSSSDKDMCSLWWRAPEILMGLAHSKNSDVWSFGAMMANICCHTQITKATKESEALVDIWQKFGKPTQWDEMDKACTSKELREWSGTGSGITLKKSHADILPVLGLCLQQNPAKRASAKTVLEHEFWSEKPTGMELSCAYTWFKIVQSSVKKQPPSIIKSFEENEISGECFLSYIAGLPSPVLPAEYQTALEKYEVEYKEEAIGLLQSTLSAWKLGAGLHVAASLFICGCLVTDYPLLFQEFKDKSGATSKLTVFKAVVKLMEALAFQLPRLKKRVS
jgi:hypothetical protein